MRRAIARGRMVPQSRSTDPRMGRVSLKAAMLYDRMWINADDQGRVSGDPDEIKYATCPNLPEIPKDDIPELLTELEKQGFLKVYTTPKTKAIQMLDWWEEQKLQWAYPSPYPPPEGWADHLRYHPTPKEIKIENWPPAGQQARELLPSKLPSAPASVLPSKLPESPLTTPSETEKENEKEGGRGRVPSVLGSKTTTATTATETATESELSRFLETLEGWRFERAVDLVWLREFCEEWPEFDLALAKACRDYHSGEPPPKNKGPWKNRFREWMIHERKFAQERRERDQGKGQRAKVRPREAYRGRSF